MSFNNRRNKNRSLNNNNSNNANNYISSKNDKQNRIKSSVDKESTTKGVYRNKNFMLAKTSLVGTLANVVHKDGCIYEGVFSTFSPDLEIVLHTVSKVIPKAESNNVSPIIGSLLASLTAKNEFLDTVIFKLQDIVMMSIPNVNLDFAVRRNFTDTEISKFNPSCLTKEKDLVPWDGFNEENSGDEITLNDAEGWDADSMFKLNEKKYNIASTYSDSLEGYTVPLIKTDTEEYKKKELEANRIAQLIENDAASKDRLAKEDGDEEDKFSAVHRPVITSSSLNTNSQNINSRPDNSNNMNNMNRRKNQNNLNTFNNNNIRTKSSVTNNNFPTQSYSHFNSMPSQHDNRSNSGQLMHNRMNTRNESNKHHQTSNQPMNNSYNKQVDQHHEEKDLHRSHLQNEHHNNTNLSNVNQSPLPQRTHTINRRSSTQKVRDETTHDLKKFSSAFKLAVQSQGSNTNTSNSGNGKENKDNKDVSLKSNLNNRQQINTKESDLMKNDSSSSKPEISPTSKKNLKDEDKQFNKPLIDKTPKEIALVEKEQIDKSNSDKLKSSNENQSKPYSENKNESENSSLNSSSIEITTNKNEENKSDCSINQNESSKNNVSNTSVNVNNENNLPSNSSDLSISLNEAEKTLKKSVLNPNAKEFVFNPTAKPYTPKFISYPATGPAVAATNLPYQPPLGPHMQQSAVHHQQQIQISPLAVQHGSQQVVAASVIHPQQPLMTTHHSHHAQHPQSQMPGQMISFPAQFMNPSIQFAVANHPQNLHHPQHTHHHQHHQPSPYLIPAVPNSVSTASIPSANQINSNSGNVVSYQQTNPSQPPPNNNRRTNNKSGQYHNSNQANTNQRPNQPQQQREYNQNVVTASGVPVIASVGGYSQPNVSGVPPTAAGTAPPHSVYSPIYHTQFSQHPHSRLMSPPSIGMIPGMTYTAAADPATLQQLYMTNMTAVPQFVTVAQQPPSNSTTPTGHPVLIPSPVLHGNNTIASTNIPSTQPATASQQPQSGQHQRSGSNSNISNNGQTQQPNHQTMIITNVPTNSQSLNGVPNQARWM